MTVWVEIIDLGRKTSPKRGLIVNRVITVWDRPFTEKDPIVLFAWETRSERGFQEKLAFIEDEYGEWKEQVDV